MKWLLRDGRRMLLALPAMVLVLCLVGLYLTRGAMANLSFLGDKNAGLVDQRPWQTVRALAPLAVSAEEQSFAQEAERLADHEVDQAFAQALREASTQTKTMTPEAQALSAKVSQLEDEVKADKTHVQSLGGDPKAKSDTATAAATDSGNDDLDAAQTQLQLDSDELDDANENLAKATGDKRGTIQQELLERETAMKKSAVDGGGKTAIVSAKSRGTLAARIGAWFDQRSRHGLILEAMQQADRDVVALKAEHATIEAQSGVAAAAASAGLTAAGTPTAGALDGKSTASSGNATATSGKATATSGKATTRVGRLQMLRTLSEEHSILEDRLATQEQLSKVYGQWAEQVERQHKIVFHLMLRSFALISFIVLCAVLAAFGIDLLVDRSTMEARRVHTMKTIAHLAVQAVSLGLVLLVLLGLPSQMPTILGLATAGVTVVFQDFILAFFGWFVLMGKNGIRVGDWVEINSVGGEVIEITLFRTMLMEAGNWTDKGHPTGRRVTFINNFAITGQYFNFSTVGQWMWDEITLTIAAGDAAYKTIEAIRDRVVADTREDANLAEQEWKLATRQQGMSQFSATPSVDLRPGSAGIDIIVRYVTRAGNRFEMRNKLYQALIEILQLQPEKLA